jgi:uncharacterized membrane protein
MNYPRLAMAAIAALVVFFVYGFLTEGMLIRKDFALSAALYRDSNAQIKYMPIGMASVLVGLFAAAAVYAKWCGAATGAMSGLQFGLLMGVFTACVHALSNLVTMNMHPRLGLEIAVSTFFGWLLVGITIGLVYKPK